MNHRKSIHPSNKTCRNFAAGNCSFNSECWYVHENTMDTEDLSNKFKCNICDFEFKGRDVFMKHKKSSHTETIPVCDKFRKGQCPRNDNDCWFEHSKSKTEHEDISPTKSKSNDPTAPSNETETGKQVFHEASGNSFPPDQVKKMMEMVSQLCNKMKQMEKKLEELKD